MTVVKTKKGEAPKNMPLKLNLNFKIIKTV